MAFCQTINLDTTSDLTTTSNITTANPPGRPFTP